MTLFTHINESWILSAPIVLWIKTRTTNQHTEFKEDPRVISRGTEPESTKRLSSTKIHHVFLMQLHGRPADTHGRTLLRNTSEPNSTELKIQGSPPPEKFQISAQWETAIIYPKQDGRKTLQLSRWEFLCGNRGIELDERRFLSVTNARWSVTLGVAFFFSAFGSSTITKIIMKKKCVTSIFYLVLANKSSIAKCRCVFVCLFVCFS